MKKLMESSITPCKKRDRKTLVGRTLKQQRVQERLQQKGVR